MLGGYGFMTLPRYTKPFLDARARSTQSRVVATDSNNVGPTAA